MLPRALKTKLLPPLVVETVDGGRRLAVFLMEWETENEIGWCEDGWLFGSASSPFHITQVLPDERTPVPEAICAVRGGIIRELARDEQHYWDGFVEEAERHKGGLKGVQRRIKQQLLREFRK